MPRKTTKKTTKKRGANRGGVGPSYTEEMVLACVEMLSGRQHKYVIKRALEVMYHEETGLKKMTPGTFNRILNDARAIMLALVQRERGETMADAVGFYEDVIRTSKDPMVRMRAQERIDALCAHDAKYTQGSQDVENISDLVRSFLAQAEDAAEGE